MKKSGNKWIWIVGLLVFALIVIGASYYFFIYKKDKEEDDSSADTGSSSASNTATTATTDTTTNNCPSGKTLVTEIKSKTFCFALNGKILQEYPPKFGGIDVKCEYCK